MSLLTGPEGRILITGVVAAIIYFVWIIIKIFTCFEEAQSLIAMTAIGIFPGRAAAMTFGYMAGFDKPLVIFICTSIETVLVLLVYPLFVFTFQNLLSIKWLDRAFAAGRAAAEKNKDRVERYGFIGLFVFVWIPFWMTGPVIGCIIGYLIGMRIWVNMTAVIAGTLIAITCWALFLQEVYEKVAEYSPWAATALMMSIILIIVLANVLKKVFGNHKNHD